uniref:Potassium calcium-activated channel subfamily M regulatory beta subunit 3 n=1 Tax=Lates calcarifer TaxID=8187 RepID=A0A4W6FNN1_LATCA
MGFCKNLSILNHSWLLFSSDWEKEVGCVLVQVDILEDWVDCRGVSTVPCLSVTVNLTRSNQSASLHFDEESVLLAPECFYVPKCRMDRVDIQAEVQRVKNNLTARLGNTLPCLIDRVRHPRHVILSRKYTLKKALFALLWPSLMLGGGALLVELVKQVAQRRKFNFILIPPIKNKWHEETFLSVKN